MEDLPFALFFAITMMFMVVVYSAAVAAAHTEAPIPRVLTYGSVGRKVGRRSLIIEVSFGIVLLGAGQFVVLVMLVHPDSAFPVRVVAGAQIVAAIAWLLYLRRLVWH